MVERSIYDRPYISPTKPDWTREKPARFWDPSRRLLRAIRRYQTWSRRHGAIAMLVRRRWVLSYRFWSAVTGAEVPLNARIEGGLAMPHPNGIVVHPEAVIGPNCLLMQQTTLGTSGRRPGVPVLEGRVEIGAGARVLGGVRIGAHAQIGANAVVLNDVPAGGIAVGVPARVVRVDPVEPERTADEHAR